MEESFGCLKSPDTDLEFWEQWSALQITFRWAADLGKLGCLQSIPPQDISRIHFIIPVEASSTE